MAISNPKTEFANPKTMAETGFSFVTEKLEIMTPLGTKVLREQRPFLPGEEDALEEELNKVEAMLNLVKGNPKDLSGIKETMHCLKDITGSIQRAKGEVLSLVEIYEIKSFMLYVDTLKGMLEALSNQVPDELIPEDTSSLMSLLDPRGDKINSFYIYDEYSEDLAKLREEKKRLEVEIRKIQKAGKDKVKADCGIILTPKFDIVIPKSSEQIEIADNCPELNRIGEDFSSVTFGLAMPKEAEPLVEEREALSLKIEEEEYSVRRALSAKIGEGESLILDNSGKVGRLDYLLAKGQLAEKYSLVKPEIERSHRIGFKGGVHLRVNEILKSKGREYFPIDIDLEPGATCITGANMGGKTVSLRLVGLMALMTQYGYYVPCREASMGLSGSLNLLVGDNQSVEKGLSGFGSEMEGLKEILSAAEDRALILVDEIAGGTNPSEGQALTASIVEYLASKPYISLLTTHYDGFTKQSGVKMLQVKGLGDVDYGKLDMELKQASLEDRIDVIGRYMDYSLVPVDKIEDVPKDAINIADMLGLPREIVDKARVYIQNEKD